MSVNTGAQGVARRVRDCPAGGVPPFPLISSTDDGSNRGALASRLTRIAEEAGADAALALPHYPLKDPRYGPQDLVAPHKLHEGMRVLAAIRPTCSIRSEPPAEPRPAGRAATSRHATP